MPKAVAMYFKCLINVISLFLIGTCGSSKLMERLEKVDKGGERCEAPGVTGLLS